MQSTPTLSSADVFKSRLTSYFKQVGTGCGREGCVNTFCRSNPALKNIPALTPTECGVLAMNLTRNLGFSEQFILIHEDTGAWLDLTTLQTLVEQAEKTKDYAPVIRTFGAVWGNPDALQMSFLKNPKSVALDKTDSGLDLEQVEKAYAIIEALPLDIQRVFASSIERMLGDLKRLRPPTDITSLRRHLILLENSMLADHLFYKKITAELFGLLGSLPTECANFIRDHYVYRMSNEKWKSFHKQLQDYMSVLVMSLPFQSNQVHTNPGIRQATTMLGWMYEENNRRIEKLEQSHTKEEDGKVILKKEEFYNEVVSENMSVRTEFINWKKGVEYEIARESTDTTRFSFCKYPFILNAERKSQILNMESYVSQQQRREASLQMLAHGYIDIPFFVMKVRRDKLLEDSLDSIVVAKLNDISDLKKPLKVKFEGEEGIDEGGVKKEWFQLLVSEIFSPKYGMFIPNIETHLHFFNPHSQDFREFELLGQVLGLAIYNGVILDLHFPNLVYKKLLNRGVSIHDLKETHQTIYQSLVALMEYKGDDVENEFMLTFQISYDFYGSSQTYDLLPEAAEIPVTTENRELFVDLYVKYLLEDSVKEQFEAFKKGFDDVCKGPAMDMFEPEELQLLICGSPELDFQELEQSALYDSGYDKDHQNIRDFWETLHSMSPEEKKKFLSFATGSDRAPIGGLSKLRLIIGKNGDIDKLPTSHTCFNHFILPSYTSKDKLRAMLMLAIDNATGFGLI